MENSFLPPLVAGTAGWLSVVVCVECGISLLQVKQATGESFAKASNALFMETSAKDGSNVHELFRSIGMSMLGEVP